MKTSFTTCPFRVTLQFRKIFEPFDEGFHDPSNFVVKQSSLRFAHECDGFENIHEARNPKRKFGFQKEIQSNS